MSTPIRLEVGGLAHTWEIRRDLSPAEQSRMLEALCQFGRILQLWLEAEDLEGRGQGLGVEDK